jgi:RND family efflux transporter MFP subunit
MKKIKLKSIASFLVLSIILGSCSGKDKVASENQDVEILPEDIVELRDDQIQLAGIQTGSLELRSMGNHLKVNGILTVAPQDIATVCMPLGGFIKSTSLLPGNKVRKGQILAVLENQDFVDIQLQYMDAKNKLSFAKAEFDRHSNLYKEDVYSEKNVQQVTVEYRNLLAMVKSLEQKLLLIGINPEILSEDNISSTVNLLSPISGFLKAVNINIGKYVSPTDVLFEIVNSEKLLLELTLFEKDVENIAAGQKIRFFVNNEGEEHRAVITQTGKSVSHERTFIVYASVIDACKKVMPGMYVNAFIEETDKSVQSIPTEAIVSFDKEDSLRRKSDQRLEFHFPCGQKSLFKGPVP